MKPELYASKDDVRWALKKQANEITFRFGIMLLSGIGATMAIIAVIR